MRRLLRDERGFLALIEILVVLVIIMVAMYYWIGNAGPGSTGSAPAGYVPRKGGPETVPGAAIDMAVATQCMENLRAIRQALTLYQDENQKLPAGIADLRLPYSTLRCPNTSMEYTYDPATGRVKCLTPGHGKF